VGATVKAPLVTVVLPVRNGAADLPKAVDTILAQTFADFELIAINDGSTDRTGAVLDSLRDPRVRVIHQHNMGLAAALNRGISMARGQYIARQDHDDWAKPTRLEKQVAFLEAHPDCALVGTRAEVWRGDQRTDRALDHPTDDVALRFELLFDSSFVHSSVMMRKAALDVVGAYATDPARHPPEDYELWSRLARRYRVANLAERLTIYREVSNSLSRSPQYRSAAFMERLVLISAENLAAAVGASEPGQVHRDIAALTHREFSRVSSNPSIDGMCRVIEEAGARICANVSNSDVPDRVVARIEALRELHAHHKVRMKVDPAGEAAPARRPPYSKTHQIRHFLVALLRAFLPPAQFDKLRKFVRTRVAQSANLNRPRT
jgi:glycosyltransferase involved in cell wall biosynthesis